MSDSLYLFLRKTCAPCMSSSGGFWAGTLWVGNWCVKAVDGGWLILDHMDRLKFRSRLVVTGAIVIGRDDDLSSASLPVTIQMRFLGFLANDNGASRLFGTCFTYPSGRVFGSVLNIGSSMMNIERGCRSQYFFSGGSPVLELKLHLYVAHNYGECCVFVLTLYFCLNQGVLSMT